MKYKSPSDILVRRTFGTQRRHLSAAATLLPSLPYGLPIFCGFVEYLLAFKLFCVKIPYFSIDNARVIYTKRSKFVKNEHARYTLGMKKVKIWKG